VYHSSNLQFQSREIGFSARPGETLFVQGDPCAKILRLRTGVARAVDYSLNGFRQVMAFFFPGDVLGFPLAAEQRYSVEAVSELSFTVHSPMGWATKPSCAGNQELQALDAIWREEKAFIARGLMLGRAGSMTRIGAFLAYAIRHLPAEDDIYDFPLPQSDIASYLATSPETVCRMFRQLREMEVIAIPRKDRLQVLDRHKLGRIAEGLWQ